MKFNTKTIHGRQKNEELTGAVMPPIFLSTTFAQESPGVTKGYDYSRAGNPTREALENCLASIENGAFAFAFSSGLSAIDTVLKTLKPGEHVLVTDDLYGGTYRMFTKIFSVYNIQFSFVDFSNQAELKENIKSNTKLIWIETPSNPLMKIIDIEKVVQLVKNQNILVAVDNTFATPYLQTPLDLGVDIVMHSATKYLAGHSDVIAGALVVNDQDLAEKLKFQQFAGGAILSPYDSYMVLRGIKTLHLRMKCHCENAAEIALLLSTHTKVKKVYYPGLENHPNYTVAKKQMKDFGGMLSIDLENREAVNVFFKKLKLFTLAESLGGVESLANHPYTMTHASIPKEEREKMGISENLIRLSVGVEDIEDLKNDLLQALD